MNKNDLPHSGALLQNNSSKSLYDTQQGDRTRPPKPPPLPRIVDRIFVRIVHLHIIQFDQQTARLGRHHEVLHLKRMQRRYVVFGPAMPEGGRYLLGAAHDASIAIRIGALAGDQEVSCAEIDWFYFRIGIWYWPVRTDGIEGDADRSADGHRQGRHSDEICHGGVLLLEEN